MRALLALALAAGIAGSASAASVLDSNGVLVKGNASFSSVTIGKSVKVGGDFSANGGTNIGGQLNSSANGTTTLGVGGQMNYVNSTVFYGNIVYGSNVSDPYNVASAPNGSLSQGSVSVTSEFAQATSLSAYLSTQASTGTLSTLWGVGTLSGSSSGLNIYNLTVSDLSSLYKLNITGGTSAIINVTGGSFNSSLDFSGTSLSAANILFNFVDATSVSFSGSNLPASILAVMAEVNASGNTQGSIVSQSITGGGSTIGGNGYSASLAGFGANAASPSAVPEPASWAMLIVGFGAIGFAIRRTRAGHWLARRA